jgi:putative ABC transport system permease protein
MWLPVHDVRNAARTLTRGWKTSSIVLLVVVAGLVPNILLWSFVHTAYVRPIPLPDADRLVIIRILTPSGASAGMTEAQINQWKSGENLFTGLAAFRVEPGSILTGVQDAEVLQVVAVTSEFMDVVGVRPLTGAGLSRDSEGRSRTDEILISHALWRRVFGEKPSIVGAPLILGGRQRVIAGVGPEHFDFPRLLYPQWQSVDAWVPARQDPDASFPSVLGRLEAHASASVVQQRLSSLLPAEQGQTVSVRTLRDEIVGDTGRPLTLLSTSAAFLMLLACVNIGHIMLARSEGRKRATAIRLALGATPGQLTREQLTESLLIAGTGGLVSLLLVWWSFDLVPALLPASLNYLGTSGFSLATLGTALLAVTVVAVSCGLLPALVARSSSLVSTLSGSSAGGGTSRRRRAAQRGLVASQVAFATLLTAGAAGAFSAFWKAVSVPPGFDPTDVLTMRLSLSRSVYPDPARILSFYDAVLDTISAQSGVQGVAVSTGVPGVAADGTSAMRQDGRELNVRLQAVSGDYFRTVAIPMRAGRSFDARDRFESEPVAVVDVRFAGQLRELPVGAPLHLAGEAKPRRIVGIVGAVSLYGDRDDDRPHVYLPIHQVGIPSVTLLVRHGAGVRAGHDVAAAAIRRIDVRQPLARVAPMSELIRFQSATERFSLLVLGVMGAMGLLIAVSGLYGLVSYLASLHARDIAVRLSLGASPELIRNQVVLDGLRLVCAGLAGGVALIGILGGIIAPVNGEQLIDQPFVLISALVIVVACTVVATAVPALRASRVDPSLSLRA